MVKTPFLVGGILIAAVVAAVAYIELRPAPVAVITPTPSAPAAAVAPAPAAPAQVATPEATLNCLLPGPPPVPPDGGKATADDMKLAHDVIQGFVVQLEGYQGCREQQVAKADASVTDQQKLSWRDQGNAAVDEANALAGAFAQQLKIYHKKHPEPLAQATGK
jgi:hypothetical protein